MSENTVSREEFDALKNEIASLRAQLSELTKGSAANGKQHEELPEETLHVIAAAVAAFLGKRATIRFVRRMNAEETGAWRTGGRATVAASHQMPRLRGWG